MIRVRQVKVLVTEDNEASLLSRIAKKIKITSSEILNYQIVKKSIDARDKDNIYYVYEVDIEVKNEKKVLLHSSKDVFKSKKEKYISPKSGNELLQDRPIIIGSGPAGLFCAYLLAERGYCPLIIEQGEKIEKRIETVEKFFKKNVLNPSSNIQFGEGGAGTFSDGKLNTLVKDKYHRGKKAFEIFIENGAPKEIMYLQKPHIGTDILRKVIIQIRNRIISMGGEFLFETKLTDIKIDNGKVVGIKTNKGDYLSCQCLILAIGHSARDTFYMLHEKKISMKNKNFAVGLRIEHPQEMINKSQYGRYYNLLPPASYKLTYKSSTNRGVYSFCMCPGGYVVNASSEENRLVVNGMSNYMRDGKNANSAIVVTVGEKDFGNKLFGGLEFQRALEAKAYELGRGCIPIQLLKDYIDKKESVQLGNVFPNTKGEYQFADLNLLFQEDINQSLKEAIVFFDRKIKGFARDDAILLGVESRTSSPIMIERDDSFEANIRGIYPCGEGAGYAGGITTAAIDGIKVAEQIIMKYKKISIK